MILKVELLSRVRTSLCLGQPDSPEPNTPKSSNKVLTCAPARARLSEGYAVAKLPVHAESLCHDCHSDDCGTGSSAVLRDQCSGFHHNLPGPIRYRVQGDCRFHCSRPRLRHHSNFAISFPPTLCLDHRN